LSAIEVSATAATERPLTDAQRPLVAAEAVGRIAPFLPLCVVSRRVSLGCAIFLHGARREQAGVDFGAPWEVDLLGDTRCQQLGEALGIAWPMEKIALPLVAAKNSRKRRTAFPPAAAIAAGMLTLPEIETTVRAALVGTRSFMQDSAT
jgi:hypothetical protein